MNIFDLLNEFHLSPVTHAVARYRLSQLNHLRNSSGYVNQSVAKKRAFYRKYLVDKSSSCIFCRLPVRPNDVACAKCRRKNAEVF
jgi:hypothetical protein